MRAPWAVGRYIKARKAHGPRASGLERVDHDVQKSVPPTRRGVGVVVFWLAAWGGARPGLVSIREAVGVHERGFPFFSPSTSSPVRLGRA